MAMPKPNAYEYVLIRLAPDPIREDALIIGVALYEARAGGFTGVRLLPDLERVRQLAPGFHAADLDGLEADLRLRLATSEPAWLSRRYFLELAKESFSHTLRVSAPRAVLTADPAQELEFLYRQYAAPLSAASEAAAASRGARQHVLARLRQVFAEERVLAHLDRNQRAGAWLGSPDRFRFDFHYQEKRKGGLHHVIQALPLGADVDERAIKEICFTVERVRRHFGGLDVAAFQESGGDDDDGYAAALLTETGVRLLPLAEAAAEAGRIRLALGIQ